MGKKNSLWHEFLMDEERYADMINAFGAGGDQVVSYADIKESDSRMRDKNRDEVRKVVFGVNFAIIGIESQETIDYSITARSMYYDAIGYDEECGQIKRKNGRIKNSLSAGERLYLFKKSDKLHPIITFVVYCGKEPWDAATSIRELVDPTGLPSQLMEYISDHSINVIDVRRAGDILKRLKTDTKNVLEFIACSDDKERLRSLTASDEYYRHMKEDAYLLTGEYAHIEGLKREPNEKGEYDMCQAIEDMKADARGEGKTEGKILAYYDMGVSIDEIAEKSEMTVDFVTNTLKKNGVLK